MSGKRVVRMKCSLGHEHLVEITVHSPPDPRRKLPPKMQAAQVAAFERIEALKALVAVESKPE